MWAKRFKKFLRASEGFRERARREHEEQSKIFVGADPFFEMDTAARIPLASRELVEDFTSGISLSDFCVHRIGLDSMLISLNFVKLHTCAKLVGS